MLALAFAATVHIGVLGSYHPSLLEVSPAKGSVLVVQTKGRNEFAGTARPKLLDGPAKITGPNGTMTRMTLGIPGGMHRDFFGRLEIRRQAGGLLAIVEMNLETAVAAIVAAEGSTSVPFEARKAQAIATRSYLVGGHGRHEFFDFCDTDHCQLLQDLQPSDTTASRAAQETRGLVITYHGNVVPALYSANCGGHTKTLTAAGWQTENYPYFPVMCPRKGPASGHGVGLCQLGAIDLAKRGVGYRGIIEHYFPQTSLETMEMKTDLDRKTDIRTAAERISPVKIASVGRGGRAYRVTAVQ
jgi:peptidoglycan hydrolase-like amidase